MTECFHGDRGENLYSPLKESFELMYNCQTVLRHRLIHSSSGGGGNGAL